MLLNENIKKLRIARGLNQVEFAKKMGVSKQCVSNWENDNVVPSVEMLVKIADFFKVTTDHVIGRNERSFLDVSDLSDEQIGHLALLVSDLSKSAPK
ncbi:MAG: helix-turn-helix transcriptional regulator [Clostridia bacterium]|nr:helix-turn-helix transcriptional regulator [Clostridia bacterium]